MKIKIFFGLMVVLIIVLMSGHVFAAGPLLKQGAKGDSVKEVQLILQQKNYNVGPIDGIFGSMTRSAVISFQRNSGILVDGIVGSQTWGSLKGQSTYRASQASQASRSSSRSGIASWYGGNFHGRTTANGETYNMYAMTAASTSLPFNTIVKVTFLETNKSVTVRINDRGPFERSNGRWVPHSTRIIDLSMAAAEQIGLKPHGIGRVRIDW